jgi:hypothetical protein
MDVAHGEKVEKELDAMIERRSRQKDPDEEYELWKESVSRYTARRREEIRVAWWRAPPGASRAIESNPRGPDSPPRGAGREVPGGGG